MSCVSQMEGVINSMDKMILSRFKQWRQFDEKTRHELDAVHDVNEIADRFYRDLEFGTGGLRGIMGAGSNRMNLYTVRRATLGLANYLNKQGTNTGVAIAYDSRNNSQAFAEEAAGVLCSAGILVYLSEQLMPTPVLSFAVRHLNCQAGIVVTASHNPKEYNGYKVYDATGCQILPEVAEEIIAEVNTICDYMTIPTMIVSEALRVGLLKWINDDVIATYLGCVRQQSLFSGNSSIKVVYTSLHGAGYFYVGKILDRFKVSFVERQAIPDGNFPTVRSPNPEERDALHLAIESANEQDADLVLGTDPDCDRVGVAVRHEKDYILLTGNQIGALLVDFLVRQRPLETNSFLVKTIVTNELGAKIGMKHGLLIDETLTGFKYIGDKINQFELQGKNFLIGYEESFGYLVGTYARDKDAVVASMLIVEMAAWHREKMGWTLVDALERIYVEHGFYLDAMDSFTFTGSSGETRIRQIMTDVRENSNKLFPGVEKIKDYQSGIDGLPRENVIKFFLDDGGWIAFRPSGTEPKIKVYYCARGNNKHAAAEKLHHLQNIVMRITE